MNVAIIKAGGIGSRLGSNIPKQFITIDDKPLLVYTLEKFQEDTNIDLIVIPTIKDWIPVVKSYVNEYNITKAKYIISGGSSNLRSLYNCYSVIKNLELVDEDVIIMQDGNRPLINSEIIRNLIVTASKKGNAFACVPSTSFIMISKDGKKSNSYIDRSTVYMPQSDALSYKEFINIKAMFEKSFDSAVSINDIMINNGIELNIIPGSIKNFKITTKEDLDILRSILITDKK